MIFLALPLLFSAPAPAPSVEEVWVQDFDRAQVLARESNKDLLVDFTGSDWCSYCKKLKRTVLSTSVFREKAAEDYILVKVDIPRTPAGVQGVPNIKRNRALARQYNIQKFPTILLMTADGHVYGSEGFKAASPLSYWNGLAEQRLKQRGPIIEAVDLAARFPGADEAERAKIAARSVILLPQLPPASSAVPLLIDPVSHLQVLDPQNEKGDLARALKAILPSGYAKPQHLAKARELDPKNTGGLLELALLAEAYAIKNERDTRRVAKAILALDALGPIQDKQAALVLYGNGALWVDRVLRQTEPAKRLAKKGLPYAEGRPILKQLNHILSK